MSLDELRTAYTQIAKLIAAEILRHNHNGIKLAQWQQAQTNLLTIKDELKRRIGEVGELKRELEPDTLFPFPQETHIQHYE